MAAEFGTFNRTSMELKHFERSRSSKVDLLLIEPWNKPSRLLIEPVWN